MRLRGLRRTRGLQLAALMVTQVVGESQTVAANAIKESQALDFDDNIMRVGRWIACLVIQAVGVWAIMAYETCGQEGP